MAPGPQKSPDVSQASGEGSQVGADALQAEAGHQAVGADRGEAVHVDGEDVGDHQTPDLAAFSAHAEDLTVT